MHVLLNNPEIKSSGAFKVDEIRLSVCLEAPCVVLSGCLRVNHLGAGVVCTPDSSAEEAAWEKEDDSQQVK